MPEAAFARAWDAEVAALPAFEERRFHVVAGLLLPIWNRLPGEASRVYRPVTDEGERIVGRLVAPEALAGVCQALGLDAPVLSPEEAYVAVLDRGCVLLLAGDMQVRRSMIAGAARVELSGFGAGTVEGLKAIGLTSEIVSWKLRLFIPAGERGPAILKVLLDRHPLVRVNEASAVRPAVAA